MDISSGNVINSFTPEKNPLRISTVIKYILEFLPLSDIKNGRLVCRQWNSDAEPLLRRKAKILFTPNFGTSNYFEYYSDSRLSTLPFTAFKFTNYFDSTKGFLMSDLDDFFKKFGKNIKSLELDCITIWTDQNHREPKSKALDINGWITLLSDNMDKLMINVSADTLSTNLQFNLENLARVKSLWLSQCGVIVNSSSNTNRIAPSTIFFTDVQFLNQNEKKLTEVIVNDFVDFTKCSNIYLHQLRFTAMTFDMSKDIVDAKKLQFSYIKVLNSGFSNIKTDFLSINETSSEAIKTFMKELYIANCSSINLTHLSQTIEKLKIAKSVLASDITVPFDLPNLKYLHLDQTTKRYEEEGVLRVYDIISWFKNCQNLVDVHLEGLRWKIVLDVAWLPKSVKRLKLTELNPIVLLFLGDRRPINVDVLLLDASINSVGVEKLMEKIKPKILVKKVAFDMFSAWGGKEKAEDFISFVKKNTQLEKIVIHTLHGLGKEKTSGKNSFLQFAGEESSWYEFNNQIAKAISEEDFNRKYYDINCVSAESNKTFF